MEVPVYSGFVYFDDWLMVEGIDREYTLSIGEELDPDLEERFVEWAEENGYIPQTA